jgi:metal-responsive CopG/Arc/MetJ family transcriptional regulator
MRRTTVFLEESLLRQAQRFAARQGKSFAQLVREAVVAYLAKGGTMKGKLPSIAGQFASGRTDVSERVDDLLWKDPHR